MPSLRARPALLVLLLLVAGTLVACGNDDPTDSGAPTADGGGEVSEAPGFPATVVGGGGGELASASFEGEDTVLWFWAPWCTTCRAESGNVVAAAAALDGEVEVIGVAGRGEVRDMEDFVAETDTGELTHVVDDDGSIWSSYGVVTQPTFAFIDDDGTVEVLVGAQGEQALTERMEQLVSS